MPGRLRGAVRLRIRKRGHGALDQCACCSRSRTSRRWGRQNGPGRARRARRVRNAQRSVPRGTKSRHRALTPIAGIQSERGVHAFFLYARRHSVSLELMSQAFSPRLHYIIGFDSHTDEPSTYILKGGMVVRGVASQYIGTPSGLSVHTMLLTILIERLRRTRRRRSRRPVHIAHGPIISQTTVYYNYIALTRPLQKWSTTDSAVLV